MTAASPSRARRAAGPVLGAALLLGLTACGGGGDPLAGDGASEGGGTETVTVGSADFPENDLVVLEDPENNFIAQQVVPLTAEDRLPQEAVDALNELSGKLSTEDLVELNRKVSGQDQVNPAAAAEEWLAANGY